MNRNSGIFIVVIALAIAAAGCVSRQYIPPAPAHPDARYADGNISGYFTSKGWQYYFRASEPTVTRCNEYGALLSRTPDQGADPASYRQAAHYVLACLQANKHGKDAEKAERLATLIASTPRERLPSVLRRPPFVSTEVMVDRVFDEVDSLKRENGRLRALAEEEARRRAWDRRILDHQRQQIENQKHLIDTLRKRIESFTIFESDGAQILQQSINGSSQ